MKTDRGAAPRPTTSCGLVILDEAGAVLLCHATETDHWDIPKGQPDEGEAPVDTALRETREETGLLLTADRLLELGVLPYRRDKQLHLFAVRLSRAQADIGRCHCTSMFPRERDGRMIPEMDAYRWVAPDQVPHYASGSLTRLFAQRLPLAELNTRLPTAAENLRLWPTA
jgi:8-oxo-dGTP pyrophosphatase MutT (NUDIX family)